MPVYSVPRLALMAMFMLSGCSVFGSVSVSEPAYEVLTADADFEVRRYERLTLASTPMPSGMDQASGPFYRLFGYISGNNDQTEKIAMTAPVFMNQSEQATDAMAFVLPADVSLAMAPAPSNTEVSLSELRNHTVAVVRFSGFLNQHAIATHQALLETWIADRGLRITGAAKAAGYNPPFTLPFLRRNEIMIPVDFP